MFTTTARRTALAIFAVAFVLLAACSSAAPDQDEAAAPVEATTSVQPASVVEPAAPATNTSTGSGGQNNNPAPPAGPAPIIDTFDTPENIDCHNGNSQTFTASWTTTNAVEVVISIDGDGPYATYEPNGSTSLPFNCSSPHTFLLTARGADGQEAMTSITLDPRNVVVPPDGAELDESTDEDATETP